MQHWADRAGDRGPRQPGGIGPVAPFAATLGVLRESPALVGLAALLTGFAAELARSFPSGGRDAPAFRWGDLWSAAMIRSQHLPPAPTFRPAAGTLTPLGLDVQAHDHFLCAVLYGLFEEEAGEARTVRVPFSGYKVGAIGGAAAWDLFGAGVEPVLAALGAHKSLAIGDAELRADGDLILREPPGVGGRSDPFAVADRMTSLPPPPALLRHPVHVAEVVRLPRNHGLPVAIERLPGDSVLKEADVARRGRADRPAPLRPRGVAGPAALLPLGGRLGDGRGGPGRPAEEAQGSPARRAQGARRPPAPAKS